MFVLWHMDVIFCIRSPLPHTRQRRTHRDEEEMWEKVRDGGRLLMVLTYMLDERY